MRRSRRDGAQLTAGTCGIGLRTRHYPDFLEQGCRVALAEAITENFAGRGGRPLAVLERVRQDCDVVLHGVSLSLGAMDPLSTSHLKQIAELRDRIEAAWVSDHLCFGSHGGHYAHDLWPLPWNEEAVKHIAGRIRQVQDVLGQRISVENVSSYVGFQSSTLREWEFVSAIVREADCSLLLDVNNVVVNAHNHGFDARDFVRGLPAGCVRQIHLAGHQVRPGYLFDNHGSAVPAEVWQLYRLACERFGRVPTIVEWDEDVPELPRLLEEAQTAQRIQDEVTLKPAATESRVELG